MNTLPWPQPHPYWPSPRSATNTCSKLADVHIQQTTRARGRLRSAAPDPTQRDYLRQAVEGHLRRRGARAAARRVPAQPQLTIGAVEVAGLSDDRRVSVKFYKEPVAAVQIRTTMRDHMGGILGTGYSGPVPQVGYAAGTESACLAGTVGRSAGSRRAESPKSITNVLADRRTMLDAIERVIFLDAGGGSRVRRSRRRFGVARLPMTACEVGGTLPAPRVAMPASAVRQLSSRLGRSRVAVTLAVIGPLVMGTGGTSQQRHP